MIQRATDSCLDATQPSGSVAFGVVRNSWPVVGSIALVLVMLRIGVIPLVALAAALVASWVAYRFRRLSIVALILSVLVPALSFAIQVLPEGWDIIGGGVRISDLILVGMWGASAARMIGRCDRGRAERLFIGVSLALAAVMLAGVARNWGTYGLSALGEFRFRYLILGLPIYLALGLDSPAIRTWVTGWLAWAPIVGAALMLPLVATEMGWGLRAVFRFYPASISLALLLATLWIQMADAGRFKPRMLVYSAYVLVGLVILKDAHRSVWLVAAVSLLVLAFMHEVRLGRVLPWAIGVLLAVGTVGLAAVPARGEMLEYFGERGRAFLDPASDASSYWRLTVWRAYLRPFLQNPLFGHGFGGYWDVYVPELGARISTSPHSVYVQTLVKTGLTGMAALLGWFLTGLRTLQSAVGDVQVSRSSRVVVVMGLLGVLASLTYGIVYALDPWPLAWVGLALAEIFHREPVAA